MLITSFQLSRRKIMSVRCDIALETWIGMFSGNVSVRVPHHYQEIRILFTVVHHSKWRIVHPPISPKAPFCVWHCGILRQLLDYITKQCLVSSNGKRVYVKVNQLNFSSIVNSCIPRSLKLREGGRRIMGENRIKKRSIFPFRQYLKFRNSSELDCVAFTFIKNIWYIKRV